MSAVQRRVAASLGRRGGGGGDADYTRVASGLFIGGAPRRRHLAYLRDVGIDAVVCLLQSHEPREPPQSFGARAALLAPTPDFHSPTEAQLREVLAFASAHADRPLLVHCRMGRGRSAVCTAAILCEREALDARAAHARLTAIRRISPWRGRQWRTLERMFPPKL